MANGKPTISPNLGLFFDRPPIHIPNGGLRDGLNFRCKNGSLESLNMGWEKFSTAWTLNGSVILVDNFFPRDQDEKLIFGTATDLYLYNANTDTVAFLTPIYATGTASASGTAVTGIATVWLTNVSVGDEISFGNAAENDPTATWYTILTVDTDLTLTLTATAGTVADGVYTIRKKFQIASAPYWETDVFVNDGTSSEDLWFATNGLDFPVTWNGTDAAVTVHSELAFVCKTLATYSNMMIYGNITQGGVTLPTTIINSNVGYPLQAGATAAGLSEQFVVHSKIHEILNMILLGDYLIVYSERIIVPVQFVGDPLIFVFRVAISGIGPISANAIADFGDYHQFLGADAGYIFDGVTLKEINTHVWRDILRQTDPMRRREAYSHFDEENGELLWVVPNNADAGVGVVGTTPEIAWTEHYLEEVDPRVLTGSPFSKRDFAFTITGYYSRQTGLLWSEATFAWENFNFAWNDQFFQTAFPLSLAGDTNGQIWTLNQNQLADGLPLPSYVRTGRFALGSGRERDLLTRLYPWAHSLPYNLEITLFMGDHIAGELSTKGTELFDQNLLEGEHFVTFYRRGRVAEFKFGSSNGDPWILDGWDYDKVSGGRR
jgi:hypothetical protein